METNNQKTPETLVEASKQAVGKLIEASKKQTKERLDPATTGDSFKKLQKGALWVFFISSLISQLPVTWPIVGGVVVTEWIGWIVWGSGFLAGVAGFDRSKIHQQK